MKTQKQLNFIVFLPIFLIIFTVVFFSFFSRYTIETTFISHLNEHKTLEIDEEKKDSKTRVDNIIKYIKLMKNKYKDDIKKQKQEVIEYIQTMQETNKYVFVVSEVDLNSKKSFGKMIINPNMINMINEYIGIGFKDISGKQIFKDIQYSIKNTHKPYLSYTCKKPNSQEDVKKLIYFKYEKDFNWIIATGFYLDDIQKHHMKEKEYFLDKINRNINNKVFIILLILIPLAVLISVILNKTKRRLIEKDQFLKYSNDVFGLLNTLQSNLIKLNTLIGFGDLFALIVKKLDVDRFYIFKHEQNNNQYVVSQVFEYNRGTAKSQIDNPSLQNIDYEKMGGKRWLDLLKNGEIVEGSISDFSKIERGILESQNIKSILIMPIFYEDEFWGFMGFEECKKEKKWTPVEKFVLKTISNAYNSILIKENYTSRLEKNVNEKIDEIKQKDKIILQQAKLAAMGEMIGNIAHQWRQPINNISVLNMTLNQKYYCGEIDDVFMNSFQEKSNRLIQKMSTTIDDFRNFFSPNKSKELFGIDEAIDGAIFIVESSLLNSHITLNKSYETKKQIYNYKNELEQVILNLVSNSKDALNSTQVNDKKIDIFTFENEENIVVELIDNGGGINEDILPKIFEPYFSTKFQNDGTGIGLYMSKVIVEEHLLGKLQIENYQNGAKAKILIPKGNR